MRVCIPTDSPGGPDEKVAESFRDSDLLDLYEVSGDGEFVLSVQIRNCAGTCKDNVETIIRRGTEAVIIRNISAGSLTRLKMSGVRVYAAADGSSRDSIAALCSSGLRPL